MALHARHVLWHFLQCWDILELGVLYTVGIRGTATRDEVEEGSTRGLGVERDVRRARRQTAQDAW
jgi:hypothetical protein